MLAASLFQAQAQLIALKTDVAADACLIPNINAELVLSNRLSVNTTLQYAYHSFNTNLKSFSVMPELRYWYGGRPMTHLFVGVSTLLGTYQNPSDNNRIDQKSYRGQMYGGGLTFGYVWSLGNHKRWRMDLHGGLGLIHYSQKSRYKSEYDSNGKFLGNAPYTESGTSLLPYKIGLSFAYILPVEKKKK